MVDMNARFFGGRKTYHGLNLKLLSNPQPTQRRPPSTHTCSQHLPILTLFWAIFTYNFSKARN